MPKAGRVSSKQEDSFGNLLHAICRLGFGSLGVRGLAARSGGLPGTAGTPMPAAPRDVPTCAEPPVLRRFVPGCLVPLSGKVIGLQLLAPRLVKIALEHPQGRELGFLFLMQRSIQEASVGSLRCCAAGCQAAARYTCLNAQVAESRRSTRSGTCDDEARTAACACWTYDGRSDCVTTCLAHVYARCAMPDVRQQMS